MVRTRTKPPSPRTFLSWAQSSLDEDESLLKGDESLERQEFEKQHYYLKSKNSMGVCLRASA